MQFVISNRFNNHFQWQETQYYFYLGWQKKCHPLDQGFDEANVGTGYFNTGFNPPHERSSDKIQMERITDFGIDFIHKNKDKPFFLSHWSVHCLLDAEQALVDKYVNKPKTDDYTCNAVYAAVIEHLDNSVGRLTDEIEKLGLTNNTIPDFTGKP